MIASAATPMSKAAANSNHARWRTSKRKAWECAPDLWCRWASTSLVSCERRSIIMAAILEAVVIRRSRASQDEGRYKITSFSSYCKPTEFSNIFKKAKRPGQLVPYQRLTTAEPEVRGLERTAWSNVPIRHGGSLTY